MDRRFVLSRLRDYVIYITIGVGLVVFSIWSADSGMTEGEYVGLITVVGSTPVLGGLIYSSVRKVERRSRLFWVLLVGMLFAHAGLLTWAFMSDFDILQRLPFMYLLPLEWFLFFMSYTVLCRWMKRREPAMKDQ